MTGTRRKSYFHSIHAFFSFFFLLRSLSPSLSLSLSISLSHFSLLLIVILLSLYIFTECDLLSIKLKQLNSSLVFCPSPDSAFFNFFVQYSVGYRHVWNICSIKNTFQLFPLPLFSSHPNYFQTPTSTISVPTTMSL